MLDQIIIVIGVTVLVMISPGPDMVIVARNTVTSTRRAGLMTALGVLVGNLVHITYCAIGIGWVISQSVTAFSILKYAGAAYLIFLGFRSFTSEDMSLNTSIEKRRHSTKSFVSQGFLNNILNPKGTLFYLGVFTVVIDPKTSAIEMGVLVVTMMLISASFWVFFVWTLDTQIIRRAIERFQTIISRSFGVLLIGLGLRLALSEK